MKSQINVKIFYANAIRISTENAYIIQENL